MATGVQALLPGSILPREDDPNPFEQPRSDLVAGVETLSAGFQEADALRLRRFGHEERAAELADSAERARERASDAASIESRFDSIKTGEGLGKLLTSTAEFTGANIVQQIPQLAAQVAGALVGRGGARGIAGKTFVNPSTKRAVSDEVKNRFQERARRHAVDRAGKIGSAAGFTGVTAPGLVGDAAQRLNELGGDETQLTQAEKDALAVGTGLAGTAVEGLFGVGSQLFKAMMSAGTRKAAANTAASTARNTLRGAATGRVAASTAKGAAGEGLAEGAQEAMLTGAVEFAKDNGEFFTPENLKAVRESAITGALIGGPLRGGPTAIAEVGGAARSRSQQRLQDRMSEMSQNLARREADASLAAELESRWGPDPQAQEQGRRIMRTENIALSHLADPENPPGMSTDEFKTNVVPLLRSMAAGDRVANRKQIESTLQTVFPDYGSVVNDIATQENKARTELGGLAKAAEAAIVDPSTGAQVPVGLQTGSTGPSSVNIGDSTFTFSYDAVPFQTARMVKGMRGKAAAPPVSEQVKELQKQDPTGDYRAVAYTDVLTDQLMSEGITEETGFEAEFQRRAADAADSIIERSADPVQMRDVLLRQYNNDAVDFLREGFEVPVRTPATTAGEGAASAAFIPEQVEKIVQPLGDTPTPDQLRAVSGVDAQGAPVTFDTQAMVDEAPGVPPAVAISEGLITLADQGYGVDLATVPDPTVMFRDPGTGAPIKWHDIKNTPTVRQAVATVEAGNRAKVVLPEILDRVEAQGQALVEEGNVEAGQSILDRVMAARQRSTTQTPVATTGDTALQNMLHANSMLTSTEELITEIEQSPSLMNVTDRRAYEASLFDQASDETRKALEEHRPGETYNLDRVEAILDVTADNQKAPGNKRIASFLKKRVNQVDLPALRTAAKAAIDNTPGLSAADKKARKATIGRAQAQDIRRMMHLPESTPAPKLDGRAKAEALVEAGTEERRSGRAPDKTRDDAERLRMLQVDKASRLTGEGPTADEVEGLWVDAFGTTAERTPEFYEALDRARAATSDWREVETQIRINGRDAATLDAREAARERTSAALSALSFQADKATDIRNRSATHNDNRLDTILRERVPDGEQRAFMDAADAAPDEVLAVEETATPVTPQSEAVAIQNQAQQYAREASIRDPDVYKGMTFDQAQAKARKLFEGEHARLMESYRQAAIVTENANIAKLTGEFTATVASLRETGGPEFDRLKARAQVRLAEVKTRRAKQEHLGAVREERLAQNLNLGIAREARVPEKFLRKEQEFVTAVIEKLGLREQLGDVVVLDAQGVHDVFAHRQVNEVTLDQLHRWNGKGIRGLANPRSAHPEGKLSIQVAPHIVNPATRMEVITHELGHHIQDNVWKNLSPKEQQAIAEEHAAWALEHGAPDSLLRDLLLSKKGVQSRELMTRALTDANTMVSLDPAMREYHLSLDEWFADNVARWMTTDTKPVGLLETMFKKLADKFKELFGAYKEVAKTEGFAAPELTKWLDGMWHRAAEANPQMISPAVDAVLTDRVRPEEAFAREDVDVAAVGAGAPGTTHNHAFMISLIRDSNLLTRRERQVLSTAFNTPFVLNQLRRIYAGNAEVELRLDNPDLAPFHAVAYGFEQWAAGNLELGPQADTAFRTLQQAVRNRLGTLTTEDQAESLLQAIASGLPDMRARGVNGFVLPESTQNNAIEYAARVTEAAWKRTSPLLDSIGWTGDGAMRRTNNPVLTRLADMMHAGVGRTGLTETLAAGRQRNIGRFIGKMNKVFRPEDDADTLREVLSQLQNPNSPRSDDPEVTSRVAGVRGVLKSVFTYLRQSGVNVREIRTEQYFPWVFNVDTVTERREEMIELIAQERFDSYLQFGDRTVDATRADRTGQRVGVEINGQFREGVDPDTISDQERRRMIAEIYVDAIATQSNGYGDIDLNNTSHTPRMDAAHTRSLDFIRRVGTAADQELLAEFFSQDLAHTMVTYIEQAVKRAEYTKRFGDDDTLLDTMLTNARKAGADEREIELARNYIKANMGSLGANINPALHKTLSGMMVFQNVRLLALSTITSLVDPLGIAIRSGDFGLAYQAFREGIAATIDSIRGDPNALLQLADDIGTVEQHAIVEMLGQGTGGVYMTGNARKINDWFFRGIGLTQWTKMTRIMGLAGAQRFLYNQINNPDEHSARLLDELGVRPGDVTFDENQQVSTLTPEEVDALGEEFMSDQTSDERKGEIDDELRRDDRVKVGLNRFVDQAIVRPDASQRPILFSNPLFAIIFHLKSFMYAFHKTILQRAFDEALRHKRMAPAAFLLSYIPVMMAGDALRGGIKGLFGDEEEERESDFFSDVWVGAQRAGLTGINQVWIDALNDAQYGRVPGSSFAGPTFGQAFELSGAALSGDGDQWDRAVARSFPLQTVLRPWLSDLGANEVPLLSLIAEN